MKFQHALKIAERIKAELLPFCERIEIAGSIRRRKPDVGDIEIVAIPKRIEVGLFEGVTARDPGFAATVDQWPAVKGCARDGLYTQRLLPDGIALDLFIAHPDNWGLIYGVRTGSATFSHHFLACGWVRNGYKSINGMLTFNGKPIPVQTEKDLFRMAGVLWVDPEERH